jgi:hypothetical protein
MRPITLVRSGGLPDWFTVEWAEHENQHWVEPLGPGSAALRYSGRVADADVEGTSSEMAAIADAIENGGSVTFRRCAAVALGDGRYSLFSPRNSQPEGAAVITPEQARHLAAEIRRVLGSAL